MVASDGGGFTPRIHPRPAYPSALKILQSFLYVHARDAMLGCAMCVFGFASFARAAEAWPYGERTFYSLSMAIAHTAPLIIFNGALALAMRFPSLSSKCAIPRKSSEVPDASLWRSLWIKLAISHLVAGPLTSLGLWGVFTLPKASDPLPSLMAIAGLICLAHSFNDWAFYWTHRLLHHPKLCDSRATRTPAISSNPQARD